MRLQWPIEWCYEPQTEWDVRSYYRWRGFLKPKGPRVVDTIVFDNGVVGKVYSIPGIVPLWPPFWKNPRRHIRMKRAVREYEKMLHTPAAEALRKREEDAFLRGTGT